jgi:hypothetical protein
MHNRKLALAVLLALGAAYSSAQAAPAFITDGVVAATIADAGYFQSGGVGLSFLGREFINIDTQASNYWLKANGATVGGVPADEVIGNNPLASVVIFPGANVVLAGNLGGGGGGWSFLQTVSIPAYGRLAVQVQLTNNTGHDATGVQWGVGFDPDQGGSGVNNTTNVINALGQLSAVTATSADGWSITLHNTTSAAAFGIAPYVDPVSCCSPIDPGVMLAAAQAVGSYGFADRSINLAYDLGSVGANHTVTFGYEYIMAVPEPGTYAMLIAGLGIMGFVARRKLQNVA